MVMVQGRQTLLGEQTIKLYVMTYTNACMRQNKTKSWATLVTDERAGSGNPHKAIW